MKKVFKSLAIVVVFILSFTFFLSKENLYYQLEQTIQKHHLIIDGEKLQENTFGLVVQDLNILYNQLSLINIQNAKLNLFGVYNHLELANIKPLGFAKEFIVGDAIEINLTYWILNPLNLQIKGNVDKYEVSGNYSWWNKTLILHLPKEMPIAPMMARFVKLVDGEYVYEQKF